METLDQPRDDAEAGAEAKPSKAGRLKQSTELARKWQKELDASKRWMEKFVRAGKRCERAYMDDGGSKEEWEMPVSTTRGKVNLFWSNVQVILAAIYSKLPQAEVDRKFKDFEDDVSRVAGIIMQRVLNSDIEREYDDTNAAMRDAVQDRFISGLGQVWCRYDVETEEFDAPVMDPLTGQPMADEFGQPITEKQERIVTEEAEVDYVHWQDFRYSPCARWRQVRWVARRVFMPQSKLKKRFKLSDAQMGMVPMVTAEPITSGDARRDDDPMKATPFQQAAVWEIWEREGNYVCWFVEGCSFVLDQQDDPLGLDDFFPCPQPIVATTLTKAFLPRPDYAMAQDLYRELDQINARIANLTRAVKAAGVYDKTATAVKSLLTTGVENALVPAENWSAFVEKGGMKGSVDWLPIEQFVNAIMQLMQRKGVIEKDLYEVLGISDIMRGATLASETATAQRLKVQYGGARLQYLQDSVARFVSDVMRIRANIISNHFQPETLIRRSLIDRTPDAPYAQDAIALLKDFGVAMFSVTVTADTLAAPDWESEKQARSEFMGACSNFLMAAAPMVQQAPEAGGFLIKLLQWGAAGFRGSKTIEGVLDQAARQMEAKAAEPPPPPQPTAQDKKDEASATKYQADAGKADAEAEKVRREAALLPPAGPPMGGPGPVPNGPPMGGPLPPMQPQPMPQPGMPQ